jgi:hypothetical protein
MSALHPMFFLGVINRPFLIDLPVKNMVKIIFRSRKTNPQYSCFLPFFMHFSLLVHAYFCCFLPEIHWFALQKSAFCVAKDGLLHCKMCPFMMQNVVFCIV